MKKYIVAARLRTLPLSISGIIVGASYANFQGFHNYKIVVLALLTTLVLQILSNFANDYGDGMKGTDNAERIGPKRALQSGAISPEAMKNTVIVTAILAFALAISLIFVSFGKENKSYILLFFVLGILAIVAAIKYTVGKNAYGYSGFGDAFVFLFFGLLSVLGTYFLFAKQLDSLLFFPAIGIGCWSVAVLNLNNMRDIDNDANSGKNTLVVKIGSGKAKKYHYFLIGIGIIAFFIFNWQTKTSNLPIIIVSVFFIKHLLYVYKVKKTIDFDPELKKVALATFAMSVLFWLSLVILSK